MGNQTHAVPEFALTVETVDGWDEGWSLVCDRCEGPIYSGEVALVVEDERGYVGAVCDSCRGD